MIASPAARQQYPLFNELPESVLMTTLSPSVATQGVAPPQQKSTLMHQQRLWGWIFLSPWIIGFLIFTFFPIIASFIFTFTDYSLTKPNEINFIGLRNYQRLFTDPLVAESLGVTLRFAALAVPLGLIIPLGIASLLNSKYLWGKRFFRTLFYMPYLIPAISNIFVWASFLNSESGWLNRLLESLGVFPPDWLNDISWIYPGLFMIGLWGIGNAILTMLATMQGVPTELYEAARVDGAGPWVQFTRITIPMISPVIFYNLVLSVIGLLQYFIVPFVLKRGTGQPGGSTNFFNQYLYQTAFTYQDMGYGATLAWVIFVIALMLTIFLFATSRRWVYYASGDN